MASFFLPPGKHLANHPSASNHHQPGALGKPAADDTRQIVESSGNSLANTTGMLVSVKVFPKEKLYWGNPCGRKGKKSPTAANSLCHPPT